MSNDVFEALPAVDADAMIRLRARLAAQASEAELIDVAYRTVDSPVGKLLLAATDVGLVRVAFAVEGHDLVLERLADTVSPRVLHYPRRLDTVARELDEYFAGARREFDLRLDFQLAKGFRREVLRHLPRDRIRPHCKLFGGRSSVGKPTCRACRGDRMRKESAAVGGPVSPGGAQRRQPRAVRRRPRTESDSAGSGSRPVSAVTLCFQAPYAVEPLTGALRAHCVAGLERHDDGVHTRVIPLPSGPVVVSVSWTDGSVVVDSDVPAGDSAVLEVIVRRWLDLDADHTAVEAAFGSDELLAPLVAARPGLRVLGSVDGFETAVLTVLGQQVSLGAARTFGGRFVSAFGAPVEGEFLAFPDPDAGCSAIAGGHTESRRIDYSARARTVHTLATAAANGLDLSWDADPVQFRQELLALTGIGPWTADYLTVRILGDRDAFVPDDLGVEASVGGLVGQRSRSVVRALATLASVRTLSSVDKGSVSVVGQSFARASSDGHQIRFPMS